MTPWPQLEQTYLAAGMSPEEIEQLKQFWFEDLQQTPEWSQSSPVFQQRFAEDFFGPQPSMADSPDQVVNSAAMARAGMDAAVDETVGTMGSYVPWLGAYSSASKEQNANTVAQISATGADPAMQDPSWKETRWTPWGHLPAPLARAVWSMIGGAEETIANTAEAARVLSEEAATAQRRLLPGQGEAESPLTKEFEATKLLREAGKTIQEEARRAESKPVETVGDVLNDPVNALLTGVEQFGPTGVMMAPSVLAGAVTGSPQVGAAVGTITEALGEAGAQLAKAREAGLDEKEARKQAERSFLGNVGLLGVSNALETAVAFTPIGKIPVLGPALTKRIISNPWIRGLTAAAGKAFLDGLSEGQQELYQERISQFAETGKFDLSLLDPRAKTSEERQARMLGQLYGAAFGAAGAFAEVPDLVKKERADNLIKTLVDAEGVVKGIEATQAAIPETAAEVEQRPEIVPQEYIGYTPEEEAQQRAAYEEAARLEVPVEEVLAALPQPEIAVAERPEEAEVTQPAEQPKVVEEEPQYAVAEREQPTLTQPGVTQYKATAPEEQMTEKFRKDATARAVRLEREGSVKAAAGWRRDAENIAVRQETDYTPENRRLSATLKKHFKVTPVFVTGTSKVRGWFDADHPDHVVIRADAGPLEVASGIAIHEITHRLRSRDPDAHLALVKAIKQDLPEVWGRIEATIRPRYEEVYRGTEKLDSIIDNETMAHVSQEHADLVMRSIADRASVEKLAQQPRGFRRVIAWFERLADKLVGAGLVKKTKGRRQAAQLALQISDALAQPAEITAAAEEQPQFSIAEAPESEAFKKWFGESKVVDKTGKPLVVYHSARKPGFSEFYEWSHFGTSSAAAKNAVRVKAGGTYAVYLSIQNPLHLEEDLGIGESGVWSATDIIKSIPDKAVKWSKWKGGKRGLLSDLEIQDDPELVEEFLRRNGYDGISYRNAIEDPGSTSYIVFSPTQIKSATGNVGTYSPTSPDIRYSVDTEIAGGAATDPNAVENGMKRWIDAKLSGVKELFTQELTPIGEMQREVSGQEWLDQEIDVWHAAQARRSNEMEAAEQYWDKFVQPMVDTMKKLGVSQEEMGTIILVKHIREYNIEMRRRNYDAPREILVKQRDKASGKARAKIEEKIKDLDDRAARGEFDALSGFSDRGENSDLARLEKSIEKNRAKLDRLHSMYLRMVRERERLMVSYGLVDSRTVAELRRAYPNYAPLKDAEVNGDFMDRLLGIDSAKRPKRAGARKAYIAALGRQSPVDPNQVLTQALADSLGLIRKGEKNRVEIAMLEFANAHKDAKNADGDPLFSIIKAKTERYFDPKTGAVRERSDTRLRLEDGYLPVRYKGQQWYVKIENPRVRNALATLDPKTEAAALRKLTWLSRTFSGMQTRWNAFFAFTNAPRDAQTAFIRLMSRQIGGVDLTKISKKGRTFAKYVPSYVFSGGSQEWQTWTRRYKAAGGQIGVFEATDPKKLMRRLRRDLAGIKDVDQYLRKGFGKVGDILEAWNSRFELASRVAVFRMLVEAGVPEHQASYVGRNVTVDFNQRGKYGQTLLKAYAFANANLVGAEQMVRALTEGNPKVLAFVSSMTAAGLAYAYMMENLLGNDPDEPDKRMWDQIPWDAKERFILIPVGKGRFARWPLPYGFNAFWVMGLLMYDIGRSAAGSGPKIDPTDAAFRVFATLAGPFNPVGNVGVKESFGDTLITAALPTVTRPIYEARINEDWRGQDIYPEDYVKKPYPTARSAKYWKSDQGKPVQVMTEWLNGIAGGDKTAPGRRFGKASELFDINPETLSYIVGSFFGGTARNSNKILNTAINLTTGKEQEYWDYPLVPTFYMERPTWVLNEHFNDYMAEIQLHHDRYNRLKKEDDPEAESYRDLWRPYLDLYPQIRKYRERLKKARTDEQKRRIRSQFVALYAKAQQQLGR